MKEQPKPPRYRRIGAGACGTVWAPSERGPAYKREDGGLARSLRNDYEKHQRILHGLNNPPSSEIQPRITFPAAIPSFNQQTKAGGQNISPASQRATHRAMSSTRSASLPSPRQQESVSLPNTTRLSSELRFSPARRTRIVWSGRISVDDGHRRIAINPRARRGSRLFRCAIIRYM